MVKFANSSLFVMLSGDCKLSFDSSCYSFNTEQSTWPNNRKKCMEKGGDLVSLETEEEWAFVNEQIQKLNTEEWHIGLQKEEGWQWVSGKPLTITKWQGGQPSGDGPFVVMAKEYPPNTFGLFNDLPDYVPRGYICEKPKVGNWLHCLSIYSLTTPKECTAVQKIERSK